MRQALEWIFDIRFTFEGGGQKHKCLGLELWHEKQQPWKYAPLFKVEKLGNRFRPCRGKGNTTLTYGGLVGQLTRCGRLCNDSTSFQNFLNLTLLEGVLLHLPLPLVTRLAKKAYKIGFQHHLCDSTPTKVDHIITFVDLIRTFPRNAPEFSWLY
eukprot:TRINITY_DN65922_c4_g9_i2.p1 TRINITY_DN65922_c4_g9~~TRINITY_DN65922_c4_g9_i2.p1  ORF type:complete len:155 (+),score=7.90 TRINITY_DN65922_c4_g9_i2:1-465(+)